MLYAQRILCIYQDGSLLCIFRSLFSKSATRGMATRVPIVGGNWKLNAGNGITKATVTELVNGLNSAT